MASIQINAGDSVRWIVKGGTKVQQGRVVATCGNWLIVSKGRRYGMVDVPANCVVAVGKLLGK